MANHLKEFKEFMRSVKKNSAMFDESKFTRIPVIRDVFIKPRTDGKNFYTNGYYEYIGNHPDFILYAMTMTKREYVGTYTSKNRRSKCKYRRMPVDTEISIVGRDLISSILQRTVIDVCDTARRVKYSSTKDHIFDLPDSNYKVPFISPGILVNGVSTDARFQKQTGGNFIPLALGHRNGVGVTNVRGTTRDGETTANEKLFKQKLENTGDAVEFIQAWDKYMFGLFHHTDLDPQEWEMMEEANCYDAERERKASAGWNDLESVQNGDALTRIQQLENDFVQITTTMTPLKSESAGVVVGDLFKMIRAAKKLIKLGMQPGSGHLGPMRLIVKKKFELGYLADFHDYLGTMKGWDDNSEKFLTKLRLFWSDSQIKVLIDRLVLSGDFIKGGFDNQTCCIGVSVSDASFIDLFRKLNLDPTGFPPEYAALLLQILEERPHLKERIYSELDYSKYDSLINHLHILVSTAYMAVGNQYGRDDFDQQLLEWLSSVAATNNAYKFAYLPFLRSVFYFIGRVPSGSLTTSVIDTIIQIVLRAMFMDQALDEYLLSDDEKFDLEFFKDLTYSRWVLIQALVYGDDRTEGCPSAVYDYLGLHPYSKWVAKQFGWQVKYIKPDIWADDPDDPHMFPDAIGQVYFERVGDFVLKVKDILSPTFLKTRVVRVFLDGDFLGIFPYRATEDILPKAFNSLSAMNHPIKYLCCLSSLGYLSVGNLEAFSIVRELFYNYTNLLDQSMDSLLSEMAQMQEDYLSDPSLFRNMPNSTTSILRMGLCGDFPKHGDLRQRFKGHSFLERYQPQSYLDVSEGIDKIPLDYIPFTMADFNNFFDYAQEMRESVAVA